MLAPIQLCGQKAKHATSRRCPRSSRHCNGAWVRSDHHSSSSSSSTSSTSTNTSTSTSTSGRTSDTSTIAPASAPAQQQHSVEDGTARGNAARHHGKTTTTTTMRRPAERLLPLPGVPQCAYRGSSSVFAFGRSHVGEGTRAARTVPTWTTKDELFERRHLARGVGQGGRRTISERSFTRSD
jgi:hypothetical protein